MSNKLTKNLPLSIFSFIFFGTNTSYDKLFHSIYGGGDK